MAIVKIKIPEKIKSLFPDQEAYEASFSFIRNINRENEINFFYANTNEEFVEKVFLLFSPNPSLDDYQEILEEAFRISKIYLNSFNFKDMAHKEESTLKEDEREMYFTENAHLSVSSILFCSWLMLPLMDDKGKINKNNYRKFWSFFRKNNPVDIEGKIEKIVHGRFLGSENDQRFWAVAAMYGETKLSWLAKTITILTTTSLLKIDIGKNFAIYTQVIAKDSLVFLTRKNFTFPLVISSASKIIQENPDGFMSSLILEEEIKNYVQNKPDTLNIDCTNDFPRYIRLLCLVIMDKIFNISADLFLKTSKDAYYAKLIKQVCIDYLEENNMFRLATVIFESSPQVENAKNQYRKIKTINDDLFDERFNLFCKSITDNCSPNLTTHVISELINLIETNKK